VARAEKLSGFTALSSQFDLDPFLFNVGNGTIDLQTSELRPHGRDDFMSKLCPAIYDPHAECPRWRRFLGEILPESIVHFLQTAVGYTLSGDTRQKYLFMMIGEDGDNGKTTFIEALRKLFGDYAVNMSFNSLLPREDKGNGASGDIARLVGARFVSACESNEGQRLSMAMLKRLVGGGDTITARRLYENEIEFEPTHKIWLATNFQPVVPPGDNAAWNRVLKIPFLVSIPKDKQDKTLPDVFVKELPGILNWALEGWRRFQSEGLVIPAEITTATKEYRDSQDIVGEWFKDSLEKGEGAIRGMTLYENFKEYCQTTSGRGKATNIMGLRKFYAGLRRLGFKTEDLRDGSTVMGIRYRSKENTPDGDQMQITMDGKDNPF
jgi:putative DNA primase/helicase